MPDRMTTRRTLRTSNRRWLPLAVVCTAALFTRPTLLVAQEITDDMVGQDQKAWQAWSDAMKLLEREKLEDAEAKLDEVAGMKLSDLRLALMADRSGTLRLERGVETGTLGDAAKSLLEKIRNGRRQKQLAEDGWHFAAIGRFNYADANFKALIESNPDPVALLELSRYNPARTATLIKLVVHADVGPSAKLVIELLQDGERMLNTDPREIEVNIERLGGPPRVVYQATTNLKASGEYAVPHLIAFLQNPQRRDLHPAIIQLLPMLGRSALNPLVEALEMKDQVTKETLVRALGRIGYKQALPYLARLATADSEASAGVRAAAVEAMQAISPSAGQDAAALFTLLAEDYYNDNEALRADPRFNTANVWYYNGETATLEFVAVPRAIFSDVMAMRCAEQALALAPNDAASISLWLAANFRREARLGMDVESEAASDLATNDPTKPESYPRSIYFARTAGPLYNHLVLRRAFKDRDPGVALGAIAALSATAGPANLIGPEDFKQPLVQCLSFPSRLVRIKAALALGRSLPETQFAGSHQVVPVLAEALGQSARRFALLVDPDAQSRNQFQALLRGAGYEVIADESLYGATEKARRQRTPGFDAILVASDVARPMLADAVSEIRGHFETAAAPILIVSKPGQTVAANRVARQYAGVGTVLSDVLNLGDPDEITRAVLDRVDRAARELGMKPLEADVALGLALEAADVLRLMEINRSSTYDTARAEGALVAVLQQPEEALRIRAASVLALLPGETAQRAIARAALDAENSKAQRIAAFASLAESARGNGNRLDDALIGRIVELAKDEDDLDLRTAGSQALGALNLTTNQASEIIRAQSRG